MELRLEKTTFPGPFLTSLPSSRSSSRIFFLCLFFGPGGPRSCHHENSSRPTSVCSYFAERALADDLDSPEIIQAQTRSSKAEEARFLSAELLKTAMLPLFGHQDICLKLPLEVNASADSR